MPQASCDTCIQSIYGTDIEICRCAADVSKFDCGHWRCHHREINGLCASALNGCRMCSELWRFFFKEKTPEQYLAGIVPGIVPGRGFLVGGSVHVFFGSGTSFRVTELDSGLNERGTVSANGEGHPEDDVILALDFCINSPMIYEVEERRYILKKTSDYARLLTLFLSGLLEPQESSTDDAQDFSKKRWDCVRAWMAKCADHDHHKLCSRALTAIESSSYLPTRVIEVTPIIDEDGRKHYGLLESAKSIFPAGQRYATLSHIWGHDQQPSYRTVRANYQKRLSQGISRLDLPACFQDAIDVAGKLEIPYFWIDSLCIIQDDGIDCSTETGGMDQVYSNSFLNLSATASSSSQDRLPSMAKLDRMQEPRFVGTVWSGRYSGNYQILDPQFWSDRVTSTRLASRGWIFQERALAPRVLHFAFDQVLWECAESECAEEFPHGISLRSAATRRQGFKWDLNMDPSQNAAASYETSTIVSETAQNQGAVLDRKWSTVISEYSRCELTKAQDKLIAISGVAKVLADRFHDTYVAGLWQSNLVGGLCWRVPKMRRTTQDLIPSGLYARRWEISRRLEGNGAPSWSWASVDGEIEVGPLLSDEENNVPFVTESGLTGVATWSSLLHGAPDVQIVPKTENNTFGEVNTELTRLQLHGTVYPLELCSPTLGQGHTFRHAGSEHLLTVHLDQPEEPTAVNGAQFLPLVQLKHFVNMAGASTARGSVPMHVSNLDRAIGIVIVPIPDTNAYRRIGLHECQIERLDDLLGSVESVCLK